MAILNTRVPLTRDLRNAVRDAITQNLGWPAWRAANLQEPDGTLRDSASLRHPETFAACDALNIDVAAIARDLGILASVNAASPPVASPQAIANILSLSNNGTTNAMSDDAMSNTATDIVTEAKLASLLPETRATSTARAAHAFEGREPATIVAETLAAAEGMIGVKLYDMLATSVSALAAAAAMGPRVETVTVTRDRIVNVRAGASDANASTALCNVVRDESALQLFNLKRSECGHFKRALASPVSIWDGSAAQGVPPIDPHHVWNVEALAYLCISSRHADAGDTHRNASRLVMFGPPGTGKTSTPEQFAARTNRPFVRIPCDRGVESQDMTGQPAPSKGELIFRDGALVAAMQIPGCVILIDEPSFLRPGVAAVLQTALDKGAIYLKEDGNRRVELAHGVIIVAADNTNMTGDPTGRHADTVAQNAALSDRFAFWVKVPYLAEEIEAKMLTARTGVDIAATRLMTAFAKLTRDAAAQGQLTLGVSPRRLIAWCIGVKEGIKSSSVFAASVLAMSDPQDFECLRGLERNSAPHNAIDAALNGAPTIDAGTTDDAAQGVVATPQGEAAANVFTAITN